MNSLSIEEFELGAIRPPSEGGSHSLLLRFTRNCSWNSCTFCYGLHYNRKKLQLRPVSEIREDIDKAKKISDIIRETSVKFGLPGQVNQEVADDLFRSYPEARVSASFATVFNWLYLGGKTAFLQDGDTLIMRTPELVESINYLKETFPSLERITSYARSKTAFNKSSDEFNLLGNAGLSRLHIGLETGDDELLKKVKKGVTGEQHVKAGQKIKGAGIELSVYIMPGLGGKELSQQHAKNTADVLNQINPDYIRSRPFFPLPGTPIAEEYQRGDLPLLSPHELLKEMGRTIERLTVSSKLCFDHAMNPSTKSVYGFAPIFDQSHEGYKLPDEKKAVLAILEKGLQTEEKKFATVEEIAMFAR